MLPEGVPEAVSTSIIPHLFTVGGFVLAVFAIARLIGERRQPGNTLAWVLVIVLIPYFGVPLYLLFGGRKLRRLAQKKSSLAHSSHKPLSPYALPHPCSTSLTVSGAGANFPTRGNSVDFLTDGETSFRTFLELIRNAKHEIHITTFILGRDATGRALVEALAQRSREGVKVRLLLDAVGCFFSSRGFCDPIRQAGGEVVRFLPVLPLTSRGSANLRNHRKIAVFDRSTSIVGGHNLARDYMGAKPWKRRFADFGAVIRGPAAVELNEVFLADWCFASRQTDSDLSSAAAFEIPTFPAESLLQVVPSGPDVAGDPLYEGIVSMIQEAEESIWIVTPYFIPDEVLLRSLIVKARAGRDVTLILPARSNHRITDFARRHYVRELQRAGARVRLYSHGMLHSKAVIVDRRIGLLGSANFDHRSLFVNFEIGVFVYSRPELDAMHAWAESILALCRPPPQERRRRERLLGSIAEDLCRLLAPLL